MISCCNCRESPGLGEEKMARTLSIKELTPEWREWIFFSGPQGTMEGFFSPCRFSSFLKPRLGTEAIFSSVQFSCSVVSNSSKPHGLQHARLPYPSPTPGAHSNSCLSSWWCHPTISSSVVPFSSRLQSFPASRSFPMRVLRIRWPKYWSFNISPSNEYSGLISCRMDWLDLLVVQGTLKSLLQHHSSKASVLWRSAFFIHYHPQIANSRLHFPKTGLDKLMPKEHIWRKCIFLDLCIYFVFGCAESLLLHAVLLWLRRAGATLQCGSQSSHCSGVSHCRS